MGVRVLTNGIGKILAFFSTVPYLVLLLNGAIFAIFCRKIAKNTATKKQKAGNSHLSPRFAS